MDLTNDETIKSVGIVVSLITSVASLVWNLINSQKIEHIKKVYEWQKDYFSTELNGYMTAIDNLYASLKMARELIEAYKIRGNKVDISAIDDCLKKLQLDYIQITEILSKVHIYIDEQKFEIFVHNHKNGIRNFLESIKNGEEDEGWKVQSKIDAIKVSERKIFEKFNELRDTIPIQYFTKLTNKH